MTRTNMVAVLLFWPALIGTYMNTEDVMRAARERQSVLAELAVKNVAMKHLVVGFDLESNNLLTLGRTAQSAVRLDQPLLIRHVSNRS